MDFLFSISSLKLLLDIIASILNLIVQYSFVFCVAAVRGFEALLRNFPKLALGGQNYFIPSLSFFFIFFLTENSG